MSEADVVSGHSSPQDQGVDPTNKLKRSVKMTVVRRTMLVILQDAKADSSLVK